MKHPVTACLEHTFAFNSQIETCCISSHQVQLQQCRLSCSVVVSILQQLRLSCWVRKQIVIITATPASNHFLRKPAFRKGEKRDQKWGPFLEPSSVGTMTEGSENGPIFGPAFRCRKTTLELVLGVAKIWTDQKYRPMPPVLPRCSWISEAPSYCLS